MLLYLIICLCLCVGFIVAATSITVSVSPARLTVREGEEAVFQCTSTGSPPPAVRWSRGTQGLPPGAFDLDGRLTIRRASWQQHTGEYTCQAIGVPGLYSAFATLEVQAGELNNMGNYNYNDDDSNDDNNDDNNMMMIVITMTTTMMMIVITMMTTMMMIVIAMMTTI